MDRLLSLLALTNDLTDQRDLLLSSNSLDAAMLLDRARRLVKKAAALLAREQWDSEEPPTIAQDAPPPEVALWTPSPSRRTAQLRRSGNGHAAR